MADESAADGSANDGDSKESSSKGTSPFSLMLAIVGAGIAAALTILAIGYVAGDDGEDGASAGGDAVPVELSEFAIEGNLTVTPGATLDVKNVGSQVHNLVVESGPRTADLAAGEEELLDLAELEEGDYVVFCEIAGHRDAGMEADLVVDPNADASEHDSHGGANPNWAQMDEDMINSFAPFVEAIETGEPVTEGMGGQPLEPVMDPDGFKRFDITATIGEWEVEPGKIVEAWMYNGQVPGPTIRAEIGDKVRIRFINDLPLGSDVHLHGIRVANEFDGVAPLTQDLVPPGETFDYEFTADEPAVAMYHPHAHGYVGVPNGLWGALVIGDDQLIPRGRTIGGIEVPADMQPAMEGVMTLNDAGTIGLSLNGKSFPATEGYIFQQGDWATFHYYNEGLQIHPMHLHQFPQLVYARDGIPLDQPYWADTINIAPGERYSVLFNTDSPGVWVWHCHILSHAERETGMFGMVTALVVE